MNYFSKTKTNSALCIIFELIFRKNGEILTPEDPYGKRKHNLLLFWSLQRFLQKMSHL